MSGVVSVIMPVYNGEKRVGEAIKSVLGQDFNNFELLIGDDASSDGTAEIVCAIKDSRIRYFRHEQNLGSGATRNFLLQQAQGKYITPCDADDILLPGNLSAHYVFLEANSEFGIVYSNLLVLDLDENNQLLPSPFILGPEPKQTWDLLASAINHGGSMFLRSLALEVGGYEEDVGCYDDRALFLKMVERTKVHFLRDRTSYVWVRSPSSATRSHAQYHTRFLHYVRQAVERRFEKRCKF